MKQNLRKIKNLSIICMIFALVACEKDLYENTQKLPQGNFILKHVTLKDLKKNPEVMKKIEYNKKGKKEVEGRIVYDELYGFAIDTDRVIYLETENSHSYTFSIIKEGLTTVDNLVLNSRPNGTYSTRIISYNLNNQEREAIRLGLPVDFTNKTKLFNIDDSQIANSIFSKTGVECVMNTQWVEVTEITACTIDGCWDPAYTGTSISHVLLATEVCSSSGGESGGPGGPATGGAGAPSGGTPFTSSPNINMLNDNDDEKKCLDLAVKDTNAEFAAKMADLKIKAGTQNFESAYTMFQNSSDGLTFSPEMTGNVNDENGGAVTLNPNLSSTQVITNCIGFMHCHLDNGSTFLVFSFSDLIALLEIATVSTRDTSEFGLYVTTNSGTFCLKLENRRLLLNRLAIMKLTLDGYEKKFDALVKKDEPLNDQIIGLLQFIEANTFNPLMSVYQKDDASGKWDKLGLNTTKTNTTKKSCN